MRKFVGLLAHKIERLQWHRSPWLAALVLAVHCKNLFWPFYYRVWATAERLRKWGYRVGAEHTPHYNYSRRIFK